MLYLNRCTRKSCVGHIRFFPYQIGHFFRNHLFCVKIFFGSILVLQKKETNDNILFFTFQSTK
ncbi:hypothetical protein O3M35_002558 [Rhynocoris fuscipes]|uniref:Uncharacterized protein n=1 Tax=Rhynocoris fuscipes TaxID=488301 RepID=A0AAW1CMH9_9HEMI